MKKKYLIVVADYYKDIANGLISSALKIIPKKNSYVLFSYFFLFNIKKNI